MSGFHPKLCEKDIDFVRSFIFMLETRREADPETRPGEVYWTMMKSVKYGYVIRFENEHGTIEGIGCLSVGTSEGEFADRHIAHVDYILLSPSLQGSLLFLKMIRSLLLIGKSLHPELSQIKLEAEVETKYNNRLYSKFARKTGQTQVGSAKLNVYETTLKEFEHYLDTLERRGNGGPRG